MMKRIYWLLVFSGILLVPECGFAEGVRIDFGDGGNRSISASVIQTILLFSVISLAPAILMMVTSFTRLIVVFSFLRTALGLQQSPPNMVLASLALFLTFFIMQPVFQKAYSDGLEPYFEEKIDFKEAFDKTTNPFRAFMLAQVRDKDLKLFQELAGSEKTEKANIELSILTPAFMISELRRGFEIGFLIFVPFLVIDLVVASLLMAMGMMMLPPVSISLPFKIVFFVLVDGWHMISGSLLRGFEAITLAP